MPRGEVHIGRRGLLIAGAVLLSVAAVSTVGARYVESRSETVKIIDVRVLGERSVNVAGGCATNLEPCTAERTIASHATTPPVVGMTSRDVRSALAIRPDRTYRFKLSCTSAKNNPQGMLVVHERIGFRVLHAHGRFWAAPEVNVSKQLVASKPVRAECHDAPERR